MPPLVELMHSHDPNTKCLAVSAVRRIAKQKNISGLHGMLIELIACDDKFNTAVDVAAGNLIIFNWTDSGGGKVAPWTRLATPQGSPWSCSGTCPRPAGGWSDAKREASAPSGCPGGRAAGQEQR